MTIYEFLTWVGSAGGAAAVLSFVLERIPAFQQLSSEARSWVNLAGTIVIALTAYCIITYVPPEYLTAAAPFFQIIAACVTTWLASQVAHKVDPAAQ